MVERIVVGPWRTNCYIYSSAKKECIIIDPGGDEAEIAARVDVLNMVPVGIALTHGHVDHVAALGRLKASYEARGYSLPVAIHGSDRVYLGAAGMDIHRESLEFLDMDESGFFGPDSPELPRPDVRLRAGDKVFSMDLAVLETPGHTPGSICFYSEREGVLFSGDTIFFDGVGRTDLPGGSEKKLVESITRTIMVLPPETRVFPGHGPFTTIEREKRGSTFLRIQAVQQARPERPKPEAGGAKPAAKKPAAKKPAAGRAPAKKPAAGKPAPKKAAAGKAPRRPAKNAARKGPARARGKGR
jgi:glyoxylase-like metal-dependent hydrolase (beta-lactamase superfamily II)